MPGKETSPIRAGRRILWTGSALILTVLCVGTADVMYALRQTAERTDAVLSAFHMRNHLLNQLRGLMIRSALSPQAGVEGAMDAGELAAAHAQADEVLTELGSRMGADAEMPAELAELKSAVNHYWEALPALRRQNSAFAHPDNPPAGSPERRQIRHIARLITAFSNEQQDRAQAALHAEQLSLQTELLVSSLVPLGVVFLLAVNMSRRMRRAEEAAEAQYAEVVGARLQLRDFAGRLEAAQEAERRKLSRELHDELGQSMAAALMELGRIQKDMVADDGARAHLAEVKEELEKSMRSIRDIALLLRPSMLDDLGLIPALRWHCREVSRRSGVAVRMEAEEHGPALPDAYRTCIYRVVQEALHNVVKHAEARSAEVTYRATEHALELTVMDDGKGFVPKQERGVGLLGMDERVRRLAGAMQVRSAAGQGTTIAITLPPPQVGGVDA